MGYRVDSKALGRELREDETLAGAGIPSDDRLMITTDITAGGISVDSNPRLRRLRKDYELIQELDSRSDLIQVQAKQEKIGVLYQEWDRAITERDRIQNEIVRRMPAEVQRVPESFEEYLLLTDEQKFELWKREKGAGE